MPTDPPFPSVAIVGLGLIGGSIALAMRERWPESRLFGVDSESVLAHALGAGAIEHGFPNIQALPESSLIVLAAPVRQNIELLRELAGPDARSLSRSNAVVTDVGGTKRDIVSAARTLPAGRAFVGSHPLGGGERGGFAFASSAAESDEDKANPWRLLENREGNTIPAIVDKNTAMRKATI